MSGLPAGATAAMRQAARARLAEQKAEELKAASEQALNNLAAFPDAAAPAVPTAVYRQMLLSTDGWIMAQGSSYDLVGKSLGVGVYRVTLRRRS